ncbi:hypothetical protein TBLA_0G03520 [Henningerozyma blattae CBS 6284]|uniref:Proteasome activator BLM10 n=1 Tax=Henningerozyma blattae (strain ATCC 34711 / CBS 6284 / DSM 70876 / NBRC 10599 / NRRL Y-10934 / UCD 77-7) TaxID=1071380 RepID=I2H7D6_HENB6|nr:hypothetical protein TBLA_0G03520 [Tetrapisispora blattae CBS 6284]CCH62288.1 hypothetical protein TBLA_0G03520 [Tetrapisispora blattae CBS 6284]
MTGLNIQAPIPMRANKILELKRQGNNKPRPSASSINLTSLRNEFSPNAIQRPQSSSPSLFNMMDSEEILEKRLKHYNLDFIKDPKEHMKNIYDPNSKWFGRQIKPNFIIENHLPYQTESHIEQAKYFCHILVNLYIAISSGDIEGLIQISSKDLAEFKNEIDSLALKTDLFRLTTEVDTDLNVLNDEIFNVDMETNDSNISSRGKITAMSATIINVNHWTNELRNCFNFDFPLSLRKLLAKVYYYLSLVQGQDINRSGFVEMFEFLVDRDDEGTDFTMLLKKDGLILDYKVLEDFFKDFLPSPDSDYDRYDLATKNDNELFKLLLKLGDAAKVFYDNDESKEIMSHMMDNLLSAVAPSTTSTILKIITFAVPFHYHSIHKFTDYFPFCFSLWSSVSPHVIIDTHMYDLMGAVSMDAYWRIARKDSTLNKQSVKFGDFGLFTEEQCTFMFNRLQGHLRTDVQIHSFTRSIRSFVYCINGKNSKPFFDKLTSLIRSIETFVHPSNVGPWTKPITLFINNFIKCYHERATKENLERKNPNCNTEYFLTKADHTHLADLFQGIIDIGSQSKSNVVASFFISTLSYILNLQPDNSDNIFKKVLYELYETLSGEYVNSRHRVISSLKTFTRIARYMTVDKTFRIHITHILSLLTTKIDTNDLVLTNAIFNSIISIVTFIPIKNMVSSGEYLTFESNTLPFIQQHFYSFMPNKDENNTPILDNEILLTTFRASSSIFKDILKTYIDKVYSFVDIDLDPAVVNKINQTTLIILESMDDDMFDYFTKQFLKLFWDNDVLTTSEPNYELLTVTLGALVRRKSDLCEELTKQLMFHVRDQISSGAGQSRSATEINQRDIKLVFYLSSLNDILRQSHEEILKIGKELIEFMIYVYDEISSPPLAVITSILVHSVISSLTTTEIRNFRLFEEDTSLSDEELWGGLQFDMRRFDDKFLNFNWHVPVTSEIEFAISIFKYITDYCQDKLEILLSNSKEDTTSGDEIKKYMLILTHSLSGASLLFDPDYNENKSKKENSILCKEKLLLLKNLRDKNCATDVLDVDIEQNLSHKGENEYIEAPSPERDNGIIELYDHSDSNLLFDSDDGISQIPSGINTPVPSIENNANSLLSSGIVFRDLDIYTCNYFFGLTSDEKILNPLYSKVHQIRTDVGLLFHKIFTYLLKNQENNTAVFQILLHGLKVWFTDVGQETVFTEDASAFINEDFFENIQSISHVEEPFTRTLFAVKTNSYHQTRVLLRSTSRRPSRLEIGLLKDVLEMATSIYPDIHRPAQSTLIHCMKQLVGSFSVIIKSIIGKLKQTIQDRDYMKLHVVLMVLMIRKINKRLLTNYTHLDELFYLLLDCFEFDEMHISLNADRILTDLVTNLKIPSAVSIIDDRLFDTFRPPDNSIDLQIKVVQKAKTNKRKKYFQTLVELQNKLLHILTTDSVNWKIKLIIIRYFSKIQSNYGIKTDNKVVESMFKQTYIRHPEIISLVLKSFLRIFQKIFALGDYDYNIRDIHASNTDINSVYEIATFAPSFPKSFENEMNNFESPSYFIDNKSFVGWLCWGRNIKVVSGSQHTFQFKTEEMEAMKTFGKLLTLEWLKEFIDDLIQDNEGKFSFSSGHISFFVILIFLIDQNYTTLKLEDLFDLCETHYDKYDKASLIMSVQLVASFLCASRYMSPGMLQKREMFLECFLPERLSGEINQDSFDIWRTLCWWIPTVVDVRRIPIFYKYFSRTSKFFDISSNAAANQAYRILLLKNMIGSTEYRSPDLQYLVKTLIFDHPYHQVREAVARLFTTIIQNFSHFSKENAKNLLTCENKNINGLGTPIKVIPSELDALIKTQFYEIIEELPNVLTLKPQDVLKTRFYYLSATMYSWTLEMAKGPNKVLLIPYIAGFIAPFLMELVKHKDFCSLAGIDPMKAYLGIAYMPIRKNDIPSMINLTCKSKLMVTSNQIRIQLGFVQHFFSSQLLQLNQAEKNGLLKYVVDNLYNAEYAEVRMKAGEVLSDIVHNLGRCDAVLELISEFDNLLKDHKKKERQILSKSDPKIHGAVIGLGAIISAFPYILPLPGWIPMQLSILSLWARTNGIAGSTAKNVISEFKKVRTDTWKFDQQVFTQDELQDLEGVLWRSYYA